jgi:hypothetical protein
MTRTFIALTFLATTALAQSFVIERIDVTASRVRPEIVRSETRLALGRAYTTAQLEQAVNRVRRLPFVVDATYTLYPGNAPESRMMRIYVVDQVMFNYMFDVQGVATKGGYATTTTGLGLRFFPAPNGALDVDMGGVGYSSGSNGSGHFGDLSAQYTAYSLFGTSAYAGVGVVTRLDSKNRQTSPLLLLGIPLTLTQTLRGTYSRSTNTRESNSVANAFWMYETSDDPYFGRRGLDISGGPQWQKLHVLNDFNVGTKFEFHDDTTINSRGFAGAVAQYWPWAAHSAVWARATATLLNETGTSNGRKLPLSRGRRGDFIAGIAHNFDGGRSPAAFRRVRLELGVGYHLDRSSTAVFSSDRSGASLFGGIAYRSRAGVVRLGVSYVNPD